MSSLILILDDIFHKYKYKFLKNRVYAIPGNPTYATIYEFNDEYSSTEKGDEIAGTNDLTRSNDYMKVYYDFPAHSTCRKTFNVSDRINTVGQIYPTISIPIPRQKTNTNSPAARFFTQVRVKL